MIFRSPVWRERCLQVFLVLMSIALTGFLSVGTSAAGESPKMGIDGLQVVNPSRSYICHPATIPYADCQAAVHVYEFAITHNWSPPQGYAGGKQFMDKFNKLPSGGWYLEYDIYPKPPPNTGGRDAKRLVINKNNQETYYTADHFSSFTVFQYS